MGQASWLQSSPVKPWSQTHCPSRHWPRRLQFPGHSGSEQLGPFQPGSQTQPHPSALKLPRPLQKGLESRRPSAGWRQQPVPMVHCSLREDTSISSSSNLLRSSFTSGAAAQPQARRGMLMRCVNTIWFSPSTVCSWKLPLDSGVGVRSFSPFTDSRSTEHWEPMGNLML